VFRPTDRCNQLMMLSKYKCVVIFGDLEKAKSNTIHPDFSSHFSGVRLDSSSRVNGSTQEYMTIEFTEKNI
jgi:hypothetical protein